MKVYLPFAATLLWVAVCTAQSPETGSHSSDRDKAGLRGPVKTVVEEQNWPRDDSPLRTTTTQYAPDGRILETRTGDQSQWVTVYTYDSNGRLLRITSGEQGAKPVRVEVDSYDQAGRLVEMRSESGHRVCYQYDEHGSKSKIETFDKNRFRLAGAFPGGTVTTVYNEQDVATEDQFRNAEGQLVSRIVRTLDSNGRVTLQKQVVDAPELLYWGEPNAEMNAAQKRALAAWLHSGQVSYSYDAKGHVTEKRSTGNGLDNEVTTVSYNEQGDKTEERKTMVTDPNVGTPYEVTENGMMIPVGKPQSVPPPMQSEVHYTYQYDSYGNWTERTPIVNGNRWFTSDEPTEPDTTCRRKLTYY